MMKFETFKGNDSKYYFHLVDDSGKTLLFSKGYPQKEGTVAGIRTIKDNFISNISIEKQSTGSGLHFFNLKTPDGRVVGTSTAFDTPEIMWRWVWKIRNEVSETSIMETTR